VNADDPTAAVQPTPPEPGTGAARIRPSRALWARLIVGLAAMLVLAIGAGYLLSLLGLGHPKGLIFKFLALVPLCFAGIIWFDYLKAPRAWAVVIGGLAGCAMMVSLLYFDYRRFCDVLEPNVRVVLLAQILREEVAKEEAIVRTLEQVEIRGDPEGKKKAEENLRLFRERVKNQSERLETLAAKLDGGERERELKPLLDSHPDEVKEVVDQMNRRIQAAGLNWMNEPDEEIDAAIHDLSAGLTFRDYLEYRSERGATLQVFGWKRELDPASSRLFLAGEVLLAGLLAAAIMVNISGKPKPKQQQATPAPNPPNGANP
jgi:hypothetical protein